MRQDYVYARFLEWWSFHPRLFNDYIFPSWMNYECKISDPKNKTVQLIQEGYLREGTPEEQLNQLSVNELKKIASTYGLISRGKKKEIIKAILELGNDEWRKSIDMAVAISDKGLMFLNSHKALIANDESFIEEYLKTDSTGNIIAVDIERYISDYDLNTKVFFAIPTDIIDEIIHTDFSLLDFAIYGVSSNSEQLMDIKKIFIYAEMRGASEKTVGAAINKALDVDLNTACMLFRTIHNQIHSIHNLKEFCRLGIKEYEFMASRAEDTCNICKKLDGKVFSVEEAVVGKNCPPLHIGCRCLIVSHSISLDKKAKEIGSWLKGESIDN